MDTSGITIGTREDWGNLPVSLLPHDRRQHVYVVGKSGTGKTTLLRNMILQDIEAGRGVGVIDPHGDLATDILDHVPRRRIEDVAYFDPADREPPVGFNLRGQVPRERRPLVASGVVSALRGIWSDFWGPRLEYILYAAVAALLECENVSLMGIPRMLSDERYRAWVVKQGPDPMVRSCWVNEFARYDRRFLQEAIAPIQNKVGQLLMAPELRNILGQVNSRIDARFMMDRSRIFIANLSKGKIGADKANLLGALWVAQFELAAMSRVDTPERERRDFFLYVDEFQSFVSDTFATILSEARKYRLCLTLAHQYLAQLRPGVIEAVVGNVGSLVSFRVGHTDAQALQNAFGGAFRAEHFTSLNNHELCAKLLADGQDTEPFRARTLPPHRSDRGLRETIIRRSRERFSGRREDVDRRIAQWMTGTSPKDRPQASCCRLRPQQNSRGSRKQIGGRKTQ